MITIISVVLSAPAPLPAEPMGNQIRLRETGVDTELDPYPT
jgi:hypothetical protein